MRILERRREQRLRGLVLAAGLGTRLRPLTNEIPKPLVPACGESVMSRALDALVAVGCDEIAINLHHLGDLLRRRIGTEWKGVPIRYSMEQQILGTLGAVRPLADWAEQADVLFLLNGDSLCHWPLDGLLRSHLRSQADATLLLSRFVDPQDHGGGVGVDAKSRVSQMRGVVASREDSHGDARGEGTQSRAVFAGAHCLQPELLTSTPISEPPEDIVAQVYLPMLRSARAIMTYSSRRPWWDLGTPSRYLEGVVGWARLQPQRAFPVRAIRRLSRRSNHVADGARLARGARLRGSVVESSVVERGVRLDQCLVLASAHLGQGSRLRRCIVGPQVEIPAGSRIEGQMITRLQAGRDPRGRDSVIGQLVFTPIDDDGGH